MHCIESNMSCLDNWIVNGFIIANKTKHLLLQNFLKFILKLHLKFIVVNSFTNKIIFKKSINDAFSSGFFFFFLFHYMANANKLLNLKWRFHLTFRMQFFVSAEIFSAT